MALAYDRFDVRGTLGSGGMGTVYRAHDQMLGHEVALKTLRGAGARDLYRFKREFRALADLDHPNLCQLFELHASDEGWFFTMELVEGVSFLDWVRPAGEPGRVDDATLTMSDAASPASPRPRGPLDLDRLRGALAQLVAGVQALHRAGKLHRDLKPTNVLITAAGRVVLLDFGLVATAHEDDRTHEQAAVGTPGYMAPEQAADRPLTPASDWYAIGVMLYEALTGRKPFEGAASQVLRRKQTEVPAPPGALARGLPPELESLCVELLAIDPTQRADGDAVLRALGQARPPGRAETSPGVGLVGREAELATMEAAWAAAAAGHVEVVLVHGESGIGKSALVEALLERCAGEAWVLRGRCYDRESVPFKAIDPLVDQLTSVLLRLSAEDADRAVPREVAALARLFPVLRRVPAVAERMVASLLPRDPLELRARAFAALRELLRRLGAQRPLVLAIDDLQWGDDDSAALLADLVHHPDARQLRLLLILVHRSGSEGGGLERLRASAGARVRTVTLGPLTDEAARALVAQLGAGDATTELAVRDAHGHPMFLTELARAPGPAGDAATLEAVIQRRLAQLGSGAAALLRIAAIASEPVALGLALQATATPTSGVELGRLRREHLLRVHQRGEETEPRLEPYHDRIRQAILTALDEPTVRGLHADLARALERAGSRDHHALVAHWVRAGEPARATTSALTAATAAEEQLAFHRAAALYQLALAHGDLTGRERARLHRRRGEALIHAGQPLAAAAELALAVDAGSFEERLELDQLRCEQLVRGGAIQDGLALARDVLARLGHRIPSSGRAVARAIALERLRLAVRGLGFTPRRARDLAPGSLRALETLRAVATSITLGNPLHGRLLQLRFLRAALDAGEPRLISIALAFESCYVGLGGYRTVSHQARLRAALERALPHVEDPTVTGTTDIVVGIGQYLSGQFRDARDRLLRGIGALRESGHGARWELDVGHSFLIWVRFLLGETRALTRMVTGLLREAHERGDVFAERALRGWRGNVAWLLAGRPTAARGHLAAASAAAPPSDDLSIQRYYEVYSALQIDLYEGELDAAADRLDALAPAFARSQLTRVSTMRVDLAFVRGRLWLARALGSPADPARHRAELAPIIRALRRERTPWASAHGAQLAVTSRALLGDTDGLADALAAVIDAYHACDLQLLATIGRYRLGQLEGEEPGRARREDALRALRDGAIADPVSLARMLWPWPG